MKGIKRLFSLLQIAAKRMLAQPWLVAAKTLGLFAGMVMVFAIPVYADAVNYRIFSETTISASESSKFPPFSQMFHYVGAWKGPLKFDEIETVNHYFESGEYENEINLPLSWSVRFIRTNNFSLIPSGDSSFNRGDSIDYISLASITDFENHINLIKGSYDGWYGLKNGRIPVIIHEKQAEETGIGIGEEFLVHIIWRDDNYDKHTLDIPIVVNATYTQKDESSEFWYMGSTLSLKDRFIISEENFRGYLSDHMKKEIYSVSWFFGFDSSNIHFNQSKGLNQRLNNAGLEAQQKLIGLTIPVSPQESLNAFAEEANTLTLYLYIICAPIIVLILIFIGMVSKIEVESRLNEIAILRSRGATRTQITFIEGVEALVLGILAALLATPASLLVTRLIGSTESFLDFSFAASTLRIQINSPMLYTALILVTVSIIAQIIPSLNASKHTVTSYKRQQARLIQKIWWQRFYLDLILLGIVFMGMYLLRDLQTNTEYIQNLSENSILFSLFYLLPILLSISISLVFLRFLPYFLAILSWIVSKTDNINFLMAIRSLHRMPNAYQMPLMLLIITINMAVFTTTLATTIGEHLQDQVFYLVGSELRFIDYGENQAYSAATNENKNWAFLPPEVYLEAPGVQSVSRLGEYYFMPDFNDAKAGTFYGVDRLGFSQTAFWRDDFSTQSFGELMNQLALYSDGVLVNEDFRQRYNLQYGDLIPVKINVFGDQLVTEMRMVGSFSYFPTWYPEKDGDLMVGNLNYIFSLGAGPYPYSVIVQTDGSTPPSETAKYISRKSSVTWSAGGSASQQIATVRQEPMRQGFFGLLTISFIITALLSFLGFFLYAVFSLRRRSIELGVLRAIGLSSKQMGATLAWEFVFLIFSGAVVGTLVGIFSSRFFVPYMQIGADTYDQVPPYFIQIAWSQINKIYALLFFLFLLLIFALVAFLRRIKIFEAIKLGETI